MEVKMCCQLSEGQCSFRLKCRR